MHRTLLLSLLILMIGAAAATAQRATVSAGTVFEHALSGTNASGGGLGWAVTGGVLLSRSVIVEGGIRAWQYDCAVARRCELGSLFGRIRREFMLTRSGLAAGAGVRMGFVGFSNESNDPYIGIEAALEVLLSQRVGRRWRVEFSIAPSIYGLDGLGGIGSSVGVGLGTRFVFGALSGT